MSNTARPFHVLRRWGSRALWALLLVFLTIVVGRALESRRQPDLEVWHRLVPADEVTAADVTLELHAGRLSRA